MHARNAAVLLLGQTGQCENDAIARFLKATDRRKRSFATRSFAGTRNNLQARALLFLLLFSEERI
jgi:hypothetical protein